jgi:hypothetical protein
MQNVINGHIFHVIKTHDLTQHFYGSSFVLDRENVEDEFFTNLSQLKKGVQEKVQATKHQG